ncbi:MAG: dihydroorotate dehydrogenase-like protein [Bacteroidales bacterium]|nr:dihydroorotate dehydrogenase-like protein [Bacteroidales bacterium]
MDLSTSYMGLKLRNPLIVSSSRITSTVDDVKKCADNGAGAIVLKSLFEEQFLADSNRLMDQDQKYFWFPEAIDFINQHSREHGIKGYLKLIKGAKANTDIPIIASVNCVTAQEWPRYSKELVDAGADGIELNVFIVPKNEQMTSAEIEDLYVQIVSEVRRNVNVPIAVKIGPFFSNGFSMVKRLNDAGANAIVVFNRFYRPDIDIDNECITRPNYLSCPQEMGQPLRWVSLFSSRVNIDMAGNTGIHEGSGMIKMLLAGAAAVQVCSTLYINGLGYIDTMIGDLKKWMAWKGYEKIDDFKGKLTKRHENIAAFERVQFLKQALGE